MLVGVGRAGNVGRPAAGTRRALLDFRAAMPASVTYSRTGGATGLTAAGVLTAFAANAPQRTDRGLALEPARTNKVSVFNANPTDLTGASKGGDATATLELVDDTAALTAAGLLGVCPSGNVYRLDNTAGTGSATVLFSDTTGDLSAHSVSFYARAVRSAGAENLRPGLYASANTTVVSASFSGLAQYQRLAVENITPTATTNRCGIRCEPGTTAWFILPQLEAGATARSVIVTEGAQATRSLPVCSVVVPAGRTQARLSYADGTTTTTSGLLAGTTFDIAGA
ncbi:MAG: hypothetical protein ACK4Z5_05410, partial [Brevundimonas sp.]